MVDILKGQEYIIEQWESAMSQLLIPVALFEAAVSRLQILHVQMAQLVYECRVEVEGKDEMAVFKKIIECFNCGQTSKKLQKCGHCGIAFYCCRECQVTDWPKHKLSCGTTHATK
mmetsp:Transcript_21478/g.54140  ORF Transcript_21478/g.54140 Transcript_21478/m.54140 type:complete len:115 (+) Transcript_21478:599-943(+)